MEGINPFLYPKWIEWNTKHTGKVKSFIFDKDELLLPDEMPESLLITHEFLEKAVGKSWFARDGALIVIKGNNAIVCYELKEESPMQLSWYAEKVKHIKGL